MALTYVVTRSKYRCPRLARGGRTREVLIGQGVELLVDHDTLFDRAPAHRPLVDVAALLQHAYRRGSARERNGKDTREVQRFEPISRHSPYGDGGDSSSPEVFSEPVADLRRTALDVAP
jgi:hypothetical protein